MRACVGAVVGRLATLPVPVALGAALSACVLITGGTDGYQAADAGTSSATCGADAQCANLSITCSSSADCTTEGGAQVCCLVPTSTSGANAACGTSPCPALGAQLCDTSAECGGPECVKQLCMFGGEAIMLNACGTILTCSPQ
jgi:hypothetical protein